MKATEQTIMQVERAINKIAQKFPNLENDTALTDIHIRVSQDSGELLVFDDDDREITRCVVEQWIESKDEHFYHSVTHILQGCLRRLNNVVERMGILRPFSFVLEDDEKNHVAELHLVDDDTSIITGELLQNLDEDLDSFMEDLMK